MSSLATHRIFSLEARNKEIQDELDSLIQTGKRNDEKFHWLTTTVLALYDVEDWNHLDEILRDVLSGRDQIDAARLYLWDLDSNPDLNCIRSAQDLGKLEKRTQTLSTSICETTRPNDYELVFEKHPNTVTSVAFVPISFEGVRGVLAIGSIDPLHFSLTMSTLFLDFLGDVLGRVVNKILQ
ncbi:MAG: DUF484 family protein [Gammaproteobacteria bacterium]|nr:DUF484 family protein [Gammaproteobacteria bacterium]MYD80547.1 DUF484 family protein [Gammaproteobacteria bacterium]